jgi:plasmid replication initiation protein
MKKELVVKDNALINASYSLNLVEQRLILLAIVVLREHTHNMQLDYIAFNKPIKVTADSYINTFGVSQSTAYETLKDACKTLFARQFSYQEPRERGRIANKTTRWVSDIAYVDNSATVEFTFAPAVLPLILHLEKHLTSYEITQVSNLTSGYAIRLYELLIAWRSVGKTPEIKLSEFRQKMGVLEGNINEWGNLKKRFYILLSSKSMNIRTLQQSTNNTRKGVLLLVFHLSLSKSNSRKLKNRKTSSEIQTHLTFL